MINVEALKELIESESVTIEMLEYQCGFGTQEIDVVPVSKLLEMIEGLGE